MRRWRRAGPVWSISFAAPAWSATSTTNCAFTSRAKRQPPCSVARATRTHVGTRTTVSAARRWSCASRFATPAASRSAMISGRPASRSAAAAARSRRHRRRAVHAWPGHWQHRNRLWHHRCLAVPATTLSSRRSARRGVHGHCRQTDRTGSLDAIPTYLSWKESARSFSSVSAAFFRGATWRGASGARSLSGMRVTPEFFTTLGVSAFRGRHLTAGDGGGSPAVVLSHGFSQRELGGANDVVGSTISLSDTVHTVVGIMPPDFDVRLLDRPEGAAFWTLFQPGDRGYEPGGMGPVTILGRLAEGISVKAARTEAAAIMERAERAHALNFNQPDAAGNRFIVNLSSLQEDNTRTVRSTLLTVLAATLCLLLIAAMNVGVLLFGQGLKRRSEVAVRHAVGAGRARLVRQFMTESLALSTCGSVMAVGLAAAALRLFVASNPLGTLPASGVHLDLRAAVVAVIAVAVTTIVAGLVPALRLSAAGLGTALRSGEGGRTTARVLRAQRVMLVAQIAVSTMLLVCAALFAKTVIQLRAEPLGFLADGLEVAEVPLPTTPFASNGARNEFYEALEHQLQARPGIRAVAAATAPPLTGGAFMTVRLSADDNAVAPRMSAPSVTPAYFETVSIPLVAGRRFDRRDTAEGRPVVVLNALAATQLFGDVYTAVGQRVRLAGRLLVRGRWNRRQRQNHVLRHARMANRTNGVSAHRAVAGPATRSGGDASHALGSHPRRSLRCPLPTCGMRRPLLVRARWCSRFSRCQTWLPLPHVSRRSGWRS